MPILPTIIDKNHHTSQTFFKYLFRELYDVFIPKNQSSSLVGSYYCTLLDDST